MKILYSWLQDFIKTTLTPKEIADALTSIGLEVENSERIESIKGGLQGIVVGEIKSIIQHPNADRLSVCMVDIGQSDLLQIVCGASNIAINQRVPVATLNTKLYDKIGKEWIVKLGNIRGTESFGMICSESELGLSNHSEGILVLDKTTKIGQPLVELFDITEDFLFEIGLTPNKIDASSHLGVARELKAYIESNCPEKLLHFEVLSVDDFIADKLSCPIKIEIHDSEGCPLYCGISITDINVTDSPIWLQSKLKKIGLRPINNIVDATNYVLHNLGQPLHAFDADKIRGNVVKVESCKENTTFTTLDQINRKLSCTDLMICNADEPMCIAGVLGGVNSGVNSETKNIFLECAYFSPSRIRRTAKRHGINTDASFRYERGTDPLMPYIAIKQAATLIKKIAGGTITELSTINPKPYSATTIEINITRINRLIGNNLSEQTIINILKSLGFIIRQCNGERLTLEVPSYRVDVVQECDVAEEILRIYGYNNIILPKVLQYSPSETAKITLRTLSDKIAVFLSANNFNEIISLSLTNKKYCDIVPCDSTQIVSLQNPNSIDLNVMRWTLLFGGMESITGNINRQQTSLQLFELGNIYLRKLDDPKQDIQHQFSEKKVLSIFITESNPSNVWNNDSTPTDFFRLKQIVERIMGICGINLLDISQSATLPQLYSDGLHYTVNNETLLTLGKVAQPITTHFDLKQSIFSAEIHLDTLLSLVEPQTIHYQEISKFPSVQRDLSLLLDKSMTYAELYELTVKIDQKTLRNFTLFDTYEGPKLPEGKKSYSIAFTLCNDHKTLDTHEIESLMKRIVNCYEKHGIQIRG